MFLLIPLRHVIEVYLIVKARLVCDFTVGSLDDILTLELEEDVICREWTHRLDESDVVVNDGVEIDCIHVGDDVVHVVVEGDGVK